jgi:hypothetical protein
MEHGSIETGVVLQGFVPVRKDPHERSEMVTQVLFGEYVDIDDEAGLWLHIRAHLDKYEGWVDKKCIYRTQHVQPVAYYVCRENIRICNVSDASSVILPIGSSVPELSDGTFELGGKQFLIEDTSSLAQPGTIRAETLFPILVSVPYIWGGRCGYGFDCSGLTQFLCRVNGNAIPRDASDQSGMGKTLSFMEEVQTGDLAFFDNTEGMIHHVGMIAGKGRIIHASGMVRIDKIDQQGIFNEELGRYTYKLRVLKRIR